MPALVPRVVAAARAAADNNESMTADGTGRAANNLTPSLMHAAPFLAAFQPSSLPSTVLSVCRSSAATIARRDFSYPFAAHRVRYRWSGNVAL